MIFYSNRKINYNIIEFKNYFNENNIKMRLKISNKEKY